MYLITKRYVSGPFKGLDTTAESPEPMTAGVRHDTAEGAYVVMACYEVEPDSMQGEFDRLSKGG